MHILYHNYDISTKIKSTSAFFLAKALFLRISIYDAFSICNSIGIRDKSPLVSAGGSQSPSPCPLTYKLGLVMAKKFPTRGEEKKVA